MQMERMEVESIGDSRAVDSHLVLYFCAGGGCDVKDSCDVKYKVQYKSESGVLGSIVTGMSSESPQSSSEQIVAILEFLRVIDARLASMERTLDAGKAEGGTESWKRKKVLRRVLSDDDSSKSDHSSEQNQMDDSLMEEVAGNGAKF